MTETLIVVVVLYYPILWLCGVSYALYLLPSLLQCGPVNLAAQLSSGVLLIGTLLALCFEALQSLLFRVFHIALWDSLSGLHALGDSLSNISSL